MIDQRCRRPLPSRRDHRCKADDAVGVLGRDESEQLGLGREQRLVASMSPQQTERIGCSRATPTSVGRSRDGVRGSNRSRSRSVTACRAPRGTALLPAKCRYTINRVTPACSATDLHRRAGETACQERRRRRGDQLGLTFAPSGGAVQTRPVIDQHVYTSVYLLSMSNGFSTTPSARTRRTTGDRHRRRQRHRAGDRDPMAAAGAEVVVTDIDEAGGANVAAEIGGSVSRCSTWRPGGMGSRREHGRSVRHRLPQRRHLHQSGAYADPRATRSRS